MNSSLGVGARLGIVASVLVVAAGVLAVAPAADVAAGRLTQAQIRQLLRPAPGMQAFPPVSIARRIQASIGPNTVGNMTYHGGPVMQQKNDSVPIFWMPATVQDGSSASPSANYVSLVERYFDDIGGSPLNQIATQYYQTVNGPTEYIVNSSQRVLAVVDTSAYPTAGAGCSGNGVDCVDDAQVRSEVLAVSSAHSLAAEHQHRVLRVPRPARDDVLQLDGLLQGRQRDEQQLPVLRVPRLVPEQRERSCVRQHAVRCARQRQ